MNEIWGEACKRLTSEPLCQNCLIVSICIHLCEQGSSRIEEIITELVDDINEIDKTNDKYI